MCLTDCDNQSFDILQQYFENRLTYLAAEKEKGENPYPHKFFVSMSISEYIEKYTNLSEGDHVEDDQVSLAGMIHPSMKFVTFSIKKRVYFSLFFF